MPDFFNSWGKFFVLCSLSRPWLVRKVGWKGLVRESLHYFQNSASYHFLFFVINRGPFPCICLFILIFDMVPCYCSYRFSLSSVIYTSPSPKFNLFEWLGKHHSLWYLRGLLFSVSRVRFCTNFFLAPSSMTIEKLKRKYLCQLVLTTSDIKQRPCARNQAKLELEYILVTEETLIKKRIHVDRLKTKIK